MAQGLGPRGSAKVAKKGATVAIKGANPTNPCAKVAMKMANLARQGAMLAIRMATLFKICYKCCVFTGFYMGPKRPVKGATVAIKGAKRATQKAKLAMKGAILAREVSHCGQQKMPKRQDMRCQNPKVLDFQNFGAHS